MNRPLKFGILGFLLGIFAFAYFIESTFEKKHPNLVETIDYEAAKVLPPRWYDTKIKGWYAAKLKMHRWGRRGRKEQGLALKYLENLDLFSRFFPGYESLFPDKDFWYQYSDRRSSSAVWTPLANNVWMQVTYSFPGCFSLYEAKGADIIITGSSDTNSSVSSTYLHDLLENSGLSYLKNKKILHCGTNHAQISTVQFLAEQLMKVKNSKPPLEVLVWGFNFANAYVGLPGLEEETKNRIKSEWTDRNFVQSWIDYVPGHLFPDLNWSRFLKANFQAVREANSVLSHQYVEDGRIVIPEELINDENKLESIFRENSPINPSLRGVSKADCNMDKAEKAFDQTLASLLKVSNRVLVYVPSVPLQEEWRIPDCFIKNLAVMLKSKQSERVSILMEPWKESGLKYKDFLFAGDTSRYYLFDTAHMNHKGAIKMTKKIAKWMESELKTSVKGVPL